MATPLDAVILPVVLIGNRSLTYSRNSNGSKTVPCGTPNFTVLSTLTVLFETELF